MEQFLEFAGNHQLLVMAGAMLAVLIVVNELRMRMRGFTEITPAQAVQLMNADAVLLDVREAGQFAAGHIVGARNLPLEGLSDADGKLAKLKSRPVITCCENGQTGAKGAALLPKLGFERVFNLRGGLSTWRQENYPVQKGKR